MGIGDCFSEVKDAIASGKVKTYARVFAVLMVLLMLVVPIVLLATMNPLPPATTACSVVFSVLLGIVELPFCCGCLEACRTMQGYMNVVFERLWMRLLLLTIMGTVFIVVAVHADPIFWAWFCGIALPMNGLLYLLASFRGETETGGEKVDGAATTSRTSAREMDFGSPNGFSAGGGNVPPPASYEDRARDAARDTAINAASDPAVQRAAVDAVQRNPELAAEALKAAAKYARNV
mmetsp:Transcript_5403/g.13074  ORF Transcript_5403/g.13074 Transcript_5403/m.13074 type:complete len:235 (+) Transcript_5403:133-837(+)